MAAPTLLLPQPDTPITTKAFRGAFIKSLLLGRTGYGYGALILLILSKQSGAACSNSKAQIIIALDSRQRYLTSTLFHCK
jgi:hypothetical protein